MQFTVGPFTYVLEIVDNRPLSEAGEPCDGLIDFVAEKILIFTGVRGRRRLNVLLHELRHAWRYHFPHDIKSEEGDCDHSANYAQAAMQDLLAQGGLEALDALVSPVEQEAIAAAPVLVTDDELRRMEQRQAPLGRVTPLDVRRIGRAGRAECACCSMTFTDGNIVTESPQWHDLAKGWVVKRTLYCEGCDHLQTWLEATNLSGAPSGVPVTEPQHIIDSEQIETFLREHPEAANVLDYV